ncbi:hypothetical protein [Neobacillus vireti]|uniref:DUF418 domain-containing protein n=1 Tax=Neobacillus vireti LMG 21834 TaxID=1131730 RepID=A0AB94IN31_9BACI|nr:hypothetical protein [Neobacillus vireti]ETI68363.1 hypothetical protein BAVI_12869 [Neobacillus vireti LMG 21834]KLT16317.1 hypothetical protein AA980_17620 [Neobacillus vireti]
MLKNSNETDFYELKTVANGRLSPDRISAFFWVTFLISAVSTIVVTVGADSMMFIRDAWIRFIRIDIYLLLAQLVIAIFFTFSKNTYKFQKIQSILLAIIGLKFSLDFYKVYFLALEDRLAPDYMWTTGYVLIGGGLVYLFLSTWRAIIRVKKGAFQKGGKLLYDFQTSKGHISLSFVIGATIFGGSIIKTLSSNGSGFAEIYILLGAFVLIQYFIAIAWPEFFLLAYCKCRFDSFSKKPPKKLAERGVKR